MKKVSLVIAILFVIVAYSSVYHKNNEEKKEIIVLKECIDNYEIEINRIVNYYENELTKYDKTTTDTLVWSLNINNWKYSNDGIEYVGDSVFIVDIDSIQNQYNYYKLKIYGNSTKVQLLTVAYGGYDNWRKREVKGKSTQYSLDGTNWFEL